MDIYDRIDAILKTKHMSRRQLAQAASIPESSLAASFARRSKMSHENIERISRALETSPAVLEPKLSLVSLLSQSFDMEAKYTQYIESYFSVMTALVVDSLTNGLPDSFGNEEENGRMHTIISGVCMLNAEAQKKVMQYVLDMNKITEYQSTAYRSMALEYMKTAKEVTVCPEDAPQTAAEPNPGSDQTDAGKSNTAPDGTQAPEN